MNVKELKEHLSYNKSTGNFKWIKKPTPTTQRVKVGATAGFECKGYIIIGFRGKKYPAHKLAWLFVYGYYPKEIDHKNLVPSDNRIKNLRDVLHSHNAINTPKRSHNKSGYKGVHYHNKNQNWVSQICVNQKSLHLGSFEDPIAAAVAYDKAAKKYFGECAYLNFERKVA